MSIVLMGSTSGSCTLQEQAVAGTTTLTLPTTSGTVALTSDISNTFELAAIGSYYFSADDSSVGARTIGSTYAGSTFFKINSAGSRVANPLAGTWRMMGANENSANNSRLYVRVS
jgi:hypothetical protein